MVLPLSVCLSHHVTTAPTCGGFVAKHRAYTTSGAALVTAWHSAVNASIVRFTADPRIRNLKSLLFLQAVITPFYGGGCKLVM